MSTSVSTPSPLRQIATRWQIPALVVGGLVFASGVRHALSAARVASAEYRAGRVERLIAVERYAEASKILERALADDDAAPADRANWSLLRARCLHALQVAGPARSKPAAEQVIHHYRTADRLGAPLTVEDRVHLAEAFGWVGDLRQAAKLYRRILARGPRQSAAIRRQLVTWIEQGEVPPEPGDLDDLPHGILTDPRAEPSQIAWALERQVEALLDAGRAEDASVLVERTAARLAGSPHRDLVIYLRASCMAACGDPHEAEAALRDLRARWQPRDVLWANITRVLGELSLRDDQPAVAVGFFDDVLKSFRRGRVYEACLLGRARGLVALGRFRDAAATLEQIVVLLQEAKSAGGVDRRAVRTFLQASAQALEGLPLEDVAGEAVRYFEMSARLLDPGETAQGIFLYERIGALHTALSDAARAAADEEAARRHALDAADAFVRLAELKPADAVHVSRAAWKAADAFESAGQPDRAIDALIAFVQHHPQHAMVPAAWRTIGRLHLASHRYPQAVETFARLIHEHPHTVEATGSVVPLSHALMAVGEVGRTEARRLLTRFIDQPPDFEALITPQAPEYRDALIRLAELAAEDGDVEEGIARLERALALYPDDPRGVSWQFHLGDAYRRSGLALATADPESKAEAARRMTLAEAAFARVVRAYAAVDEDRLSGVEQAQLRSAYARRADCLFDLGRYADALSAYAEVMWRYEQAPAAVSAAIQVVQCNLRLGRRDDARRSLERARWIVGRIPEAAFRSEPAMPDRAYWVELTERLAKSGLVS